MSNRAGPQSGEAMKEGAGQGRQKEKQREMGNIRERKRD